MRAILTIMIAISLSACSTLGLFDGDPSSLEGGESPKVEGAVALPKSASRDELELQIARLSARIDELETQVVQQKERGKIIEKGLLLGLIPDELKSESVAENREAPLEPNPVTQMSAVKLLEVKTPEAPANEGSEDRESYRKMIQKAQDIFNRANYGQAITAYNEIGAKFDDRITEGSHHYWIGLSWYYLKEYKLSEESFQALLARYPGSPWASHSEYYLAKVDLSRGFHQKALAQFQKILDENPSRDLGEMAQSEIERMKEKL